MTDDIDSWLTALGLAEYVEVFRKEEVDLHGLGLLSEHDLKDMGLPLGPRKKLLNAIASLHPMAAASFPAERRHLTILFCDIVASTEYADRLDPEDFRRLVEQFLNTCSSIVQRHRGQLASYIGDAIMAYFGYPTADEDDAERALLAGLEILEALSRVSGADEQPLQVRVGVASGQAVVGNFPGAPAGVSIAAFGSVVHLAARLQTLAQPNTILTDTATFQAASGAMKFVDFGQHGLKGFSDPVQIWKVCKARPLRTRFARRTSLTRFYGRDSEIQQLTRCWQDVTQSRRGQAVMISGEAGIGKSRLIHEIQQLLQPPGHLLVQCSPAFQKSTLYPFLMELKRYAGIADDDPIESKRTKLESVLATSDVPLEISLPIFARLLSLEPAENTALSGISVRQQRQYTKRVFTDWIRHIAPEHGFLLVIEDEQWADLTSRELLEEIIEILRAIPALILLSVRTEHDEALGERSGLLHLRLKPLGTKDAAAIIRDIASAVAPSEEVVKFVLDRAEGVPLFLEELTRSALELGLPAHPLSAPSQAVEDEIPSSLQSSLLGRLDRLGPAREIAQVASTIGREFSLQLLQEVSGAPETAVRTALSDLVGAGLIIPKDMSDGSVYVFRHALLQQAAQRTLLRERRQQLHALIAETMEKRDPEAAAAYPELVAQHFAEGSLFDRAADYWLLAGLKAGTTWAKVEAAELFKKGIESAQRIPVSSERERRILHLELELGDVLYAAFGYLTGEGTAAYHRAMELSEKLGDLEALVRALDGLFGTHFNSGRFPEAIAASEKLIEIGENRGNVKALVLGLQFKGMSLFCRGQLASARLYLERALSYRAKAGEVGSDFPSMALIYLSWTVQILGDQEGALQLFREAEAVARSQSPYRLAACLGNGCILFAFRDDSASVVELTGELLPLAQEHGFNLWSKMGQFFRGWAVTDRDGSPAGLISMEETIASLENQEVDKSCYFGMLGRAYLRTERLNQAMGAVRQGLGQSNKIGEHYYTAELLRLRGEIELAQAGDVQTAEGSFREAIAFAQGQAAGWWERKAKESLNCLRLEPQREDYENHDTPARPIPPARGTPV